jgi:hypothetical protein
MYQLPSLKKLKRELHVTAIVCTKNDDGGEKKLKKT